ncbi:MAG: holo-ACP synthase [Candidatus Cloacimonetes bacterium]|nr:holo-ACP synthase [Candidatus Cloacimonadota bacterium]
MILGIGTDIIEVRRIQNSLENIKKFKERIFSEEEIIYCDSMAQNFCAYAARFAAKEAFLKAIGTGLRNGIDFKDIFIVNDDLGKPMLSFRGEALNLFFKNRKYKIHVSLSHLKEYATAMVVIEENLQEEKCL